jgi:hypothetical protein
MAGSCGWNSCGTQEANRQVTKRDKNGMSAGPSPPGAAHGPGGDAAGRENPPSEDDDGSLNWSIWPLKENALRSVAVVLFLAVVIWAVATIFGPLWILPSAFILLFFLAGFFFPTFYQLDQDAASMRGLITRKKRSWSKVKNYYLGAKGVHLSISERPSKLESSRGLYLPFGKQREDIDRKEIVAFIEGKLKSER